MDVTGPVRIHCRYALIANPVARARSIARCWERRATVAAPCILKLMSAVPEDRGPRDADRQFFAALLAADVEALDDLLADDFLLIDVLQGGEIPRAALLEAMAGGVVRFEVIEVLESRERRHGNVALITGRTEMRGQGGGQAWTARSRYTHVFVLQQGRWRLVAAQGTQMART